MHETLVESGGSPLPPKKQRNGLPAGWRWSNVLLCALTTCASIAIVVELGQQWNGADDAWDDECSATDNWAPLPDSSVALTRVAFGSCMHQDLPHPHWDTLWSLRPNITILGGDTVYGDCKAKDCAELSAAYAKLADKPSFRGVKGVMPMVAVWDDHDIGQNDGGVDNPYKQKAKELAAAFYDLAEEDPRRDREGLYTSYTYGPAGKTMQIILLDTRWFRSPLDCWWEDCETRVNETGKQRYKPSSDTSKTMLGEAQWAWLEKELTKPAEVRLVMSSIQFLSSGHGWERWGTLPSEQQRFFATVKRAQGNGGGNGIVLLSGDRHAGGFYHAEQGVAMETGTVDMAYGVWEVTSSSFTHTHVDPAPCQTQWPTATAAAGLGCDEADPLRLGKGLVRVNNLGLVDMDWAAGMLTLTLAPVAWPRASDATTRNRTVIESHTIDIKTMQGVQTCFGSDCTDD